MFWAQPLREPLRAPETAFAKTRVVCILDELWLVCFFLASLGPYGHKKHTSHNCSKILHSPLLSKTGVGSFWSGLEPNRVFVIQVVNWPYSLVVAF